MGSLTDGLVSAAVSPDGRNLNAASYFQNQSARFSIRRDGALAAQERVATKDGPIYPILTLDGEHLYASNERSESVSGYAVDDSGRLAELPSSPYPSGVFPHVSDITPDGRFLYVPSGGVTGYEIGGDGALRQVAATTDQSDFSSDQCVVSPSGRVLSV
jgi:6-phosphogluconolactonase